MTVRSRQLAHRVTTRHLGAAYPFMAGPALGSRGVQLGVDVHGAAFVYDPWQLYRQGVLTNPNLLVIGEVGSGKSALKKSYLLRQMAFGRRCVSINAKREDERLCEAVGVDPIRLERGGLVRLNPLDARIAGAGAEAREVRASQLRLLRAIIGASLHRELSPEEQAAGKQALLAAAEDGLPTLPAVAERLLRPSDQASQRLATTRPRLAAASREAALALLRLCEDDLQGMFDGPTSGRVDFDAPLVAFDLSAVGEEDALGILRICAAAFVQHRLQSESSRQRIVVLDEAWKLLASLATARWLQESYKLARALGVQNIAIVHRLSDLSAAGAAGSEQVELAMGLLADTQTQVIFQQPPGEIARVRELLSLNSVEAELVSQLPRGTALWRVNRRSFLVRHQLTSEEAWIVDTDQHMEPKGQMFSNREGPTGTEAA
jgi:type IV secretory pathway VirB4 component